MTTTYEFTPQEINVIRQTLRERYEHDVSIELADSELRLDPGSPELTICPTVYWSQNDCHFVLCKMGKQRFYAQFFYGPDEEYGTGRPYYDDVFDAAVSVLRAQADHELSQRWKF